MRHDVIVILLAAIAAIAAASLAINIYFTARCWRMESIRPPASVRVIPGGLE